jgi:predicted ATPase
VLTRIEIDGFKSFADFSLDIPPFLAIVGPNASGKSNLFDAIQLLSSLATQAVGRAFGTGRGEMNEVFRRDSAGMTESTMRFAVEVLLDRSITDQFGSTANIVHTRLRYEVHIGRRRDRDDLLVPYIVHEAVIPIDRDEDRWVSMVQPSPQFESSQLRYNTRLAPSLTTTEKATSPVFVLLPHDGSNASPLEFSASKAETTVLSVVTMHESPAMFALRSELASWRFLHLDPSSLGRPVREGESADQLTADGANLALVLRRIQQRTADETGSLLTEIVVDLTRIVRGVVGVEVVEDPGRRQWELYLRIRDEGRVSARTASAGTLRVLALLTALYDPAGGGLICFEEPENGIYPQRLRDLLRQLQALVVDPRDTSPDPGPLAQLLLTSHSPVLLQELAADRVVIFDWVTRVGPKPARPSRITRARWIRDKGTGPVALDEVGRYATMAERDAMIGIDQAKGLLA